MCRRLRIHGPRRATVQGYRALSVTVLALLASCGGDRPRPSASPPLAPSPAPPPAPPGPASALDGAYELVLVADASCNNLPPETRHRRYVARFTGSPVAYLYGARFLGGAVYAQWNVVYLNATEQSLWFQDPPLWESLSGESTLVIHGAANGPVQPGGSTSFWGRYEYCADRQPDAYPKCATTLVTCTSAHHQLTLQPR